MRERECIPRVTSTCPFHPLVTIFLCILEGIEYWRRRGGEEERRRGGEEERRRGGEEERRRGGEEERRRGGGTYECKG